MSRRSGRASVLARLVAALSITALALAPSVALADDAEIYDDAREVEIAQPFSLFAARSAPTGEWVEFKRSEGKLSVQTSEYYIAPNANSDGSVQVTVKTSQYHKPGTGGKVYWTSTKTLYDNGVQCAFIGENWDDVALEGETISQQVSFAVRDGGPHHITSTETDFRGTSGTSAGWDFTIDIPWRISASAGTGGSISPNGHSLVLQGSSKAYTIAASSGYRIKDVTVDGKSIGAKSSYTFENVRGDHSISTSFQKVWTVKFVDQVTGEVISTQTIDDGSGAEGPSAPSHNGWRFDGWSEDFSNVKKDLTVIGRYTKLHAVTFKNWNGDTLKTETVADGGKATAPSAPTRRGWTFTGWDKDFSRVTAPIVVTAQFSPIISVRVPTTLPCRIMADGTVVVPQDYAIENLSTVAVRASSIKTTGMPKDASYELKDGSTKVHGWGGSDQRAGELKIAAEASKGLSVSVSKVSGTGEWRKLADIAAKSGTALDLCSISYSFEMAT